MKKIICMLFMAGISLNARANVKAFFNYAVFHAPAKGSYVETYLTVNGSSVIFKKQKLKFSAGVHVEILFKQGETFISGNKYNLNSPEILDTSNKPSFIDLQRYWLKPGTYTMELQVSDKNTLKQPAVSISETITVPEETGKIYISDVELAESFAKTTEAGNISKNGYDIVPYPLTHFPESMSAISFYAEIYNTIGQLKDDKFLLEYYIESAEMKEMISGFHTFSKQKPAEVNILMGQFDISQLSTGNYKLVIEARNANNELLAQKKLAFSRFAKRVKIELSNIKSVDTAGTFISKVTSVDTLREYIDFLWPISSTSERDWQQNQMDNGNMKLMQQYIYAFWKNRNPQNPEQAFNIYRKQALGVKKAFACGKIPGYRTDRGRVYLQYGAPSASQQVPNEPDSYPYEIWQYYRIENPANGQYQTNKKFVFYNPTLDGNCFTLLHSDARGEMRDDRWQIKLKQRNNQILNLDQNTPNNSSYGDNASDIFNNPR